MLSYVKRNPDYTREEFWKYWGEQHAPKVAPLASYFNITRYQQVRVGGLIPPTALDACGPASKDLVPFDGIAMFLYDSPDDLVAFLAHPYYIEIVEPDERLFIDKSAFGGGQVAVYAGSHVEVIDEGKDVWLGDDEIRQKYEDLFESYQK